MILQLEEMLALAGKVKDWTNQSKEETRVSVRGEDFIEKTKTTYRNTYYGNVPGTGNPPVMIGVSHVEGEYFDFGTHFNEDTSLEIRSYVDGRDVGYAKVPGTSKPELDEDVNREIMGLAKLFVSAQKNYHDRFHDCDERQEETAEKNSERAVKRAKKLLRAKK